MQSSAEQAVSVAFGGQRLLLDAAGSVFWPQEGWLIVSDLHLEKASFLAQFGAALPLRDSEDTLARLARLIERYRPKAVVSLGDSFHDAKAFARLAPHTREALLALIGSVQEWHWVLGNHDANLPAELPGIPAMRIERQGIALLHEPQALHHPQIIGHFHPKLQLRLNGAKVSGKAFALSERYLLMPAFGSYAGGLDLAHPTLASLLETPRRYLIYRQQIWKV